MSAKGVTFIPRETFPNYRIPRSYFLGHHAKTISRMRSMIRHVDLIFEIRDARAPFTTRNPVFDDIIALRSKVVVYTKTDMSAIPESKFAEWHKGEEFCLLNARNPRSSMALLGLAEKHAWAKQREQSSEVDITADTGLTTMIMGMPNVGKSTLLNSLRVSGTGNETKAAQTGAMAGITRAIPTLVTISKEPKIMLYDTPGISIPRAMDQNTMLILTLLGCTKTSMVDAQIQADFLLYHLNRIDPKLYNAYSDPTNDIEEFLMSYCKRRRMRSRGGYPDFEGASLQWVENWRTGREGKIAYDDWQDPGIYEKWQDQTRLRQRRDVSRPNIKNMKIV
ncbi:P-loop containing nucleoside triphosphate hydrolase protein [Lipomyces oligophaga]|uniref:P-loop containing nucleoside triphosphate hydrolase protein n=1 Tax=Lipomyces oligophaga TaxID=45792 RepID=UPI0034CE5285